MTGFIRYFPAILVIWATAFNAILAVVNAHVALSPNIVIAAEVGTVGLAQFLAIKYFREEMTVWYVLFVVILMLWLMRSLLTESLDVKYVRDVLIIPTFIVLGMVSQRENLTRTVVIIHIIVLAVMFYEAIDTDGYARLFEVQKYYINTRGYADDNFWNKDLICSLAPSGRRTGFSCHFSICIVFRRSSWSRCRWAIMPW